MSELSRFYEFERSYRNDWPQSETKSMWEDIIPLNHTKEEELAIIRGNIILRGNPPIYNDPNGILLTEENKDQWLVNDNIKIRVDKNEI